MIQFLVPLGVAIILALTKDDKKETAPTPEKDDSIKTENWVFVRSDDFDKSKLRFVSEIGARQFYDKIVEAKRIKYSDILKFDKDEKKLYDKNEKEGDAGKDVFPRLTDESVVQEVVLGHGDNEIESKELI